MALTPEQKKLIARGTKRFNKARDLFQDELSKKNHHHNTNNIVQLKLIRK